MQSGYIAMVRYGTKIMIRELQDGTASCEDKPGRRVIGRDIAMIVACHTMFRSDGI